MIDLNNFYNDGMGWICRRCERELAADDDEVENAHSRFFREGEAESKFPDLSTKALAKWLDRLHQTLICPRCGVTEPVDKA